MTCWRRGPSWDSTCVSERWLRLSEENRQLAITNFDRKRILDNEIAHSTLRSIWEKSGDLKCWYVGDYLLMPDHIHFFAKPGSESEPMGKWVKMWKSTSAHEWIKRGLAQSPIWQDEYFDRYLRSNESYAQKWEYVQNNPVRAGLVNKVEDWPYRGWIFRLGVVEK